MMDTAVEAGSGREERSGRVGKDAVSGLEGMVIEGARGLMGVTGREWRRYQTNTVGLVGNELGHDRS